MSKLGRNDWLALALGVVIGVAVGLFYTWLINPVEYVNTPPASLRQSYQEEYLALIAASYRATGNLERAEARLALFDLIDPAERLTELAQQRVAADADDNSAQALALLASDLSRPPTRLTSNQTATSPATTASTTPVVILDSTPTPTSRPSRTPTAAATAGLPFELAQRQQVCDPAITPPLLQVEVFDGAGEPVAGVEVRVLSDQGEDRFYTGLKPELGLGYGDFTMDPALRYTVQLPQAANIVTAVESQPCSSEVGDSYPGSILLTFEQPGS